MNREQPSRRGFFKAVAIGGAAAAAAVATTVVGQRGTGKSTAAAGPTTPLGYRETEHIKHYYRTTQV